MKVPLLDLKASYLEQKEAIDAAIGQVLESQSFILGPRVKELETRLARYIGVPHALGCASGSDALLLALMALDLKPGDEVVTTPFSFFATAGCVSRLGARPVFVDIEEDTFNIDLAQAEAAITPRTRALLPVHLFGQCSDLSALAALQGRTGLPVVEDAAQAIGARWGELCAGAVGKVGCFSFYPSKNLGAFGDGGLVTTGDPDLNVRLTALRAHGNYPRKYYHKWVGINSRLDAIQAAILLVRLERLDAWNQARRDNAQRYREMFRAVGLTEHVVLPVERPEALHIYNQFCIRGPKRDALREHLQAAGVGTEIYYPLPLHLQECFSDLGYTQGAFPIAEEAARSSVALPIYPELSEAQQAHVVDTIAAFYGVAGRVGEGHA